jgi:hypothetical protein
MSRSGLAEITETVGDVVSSGASAIGELAGSAASRTGELASVAVEQASSALEKVTEQVGHVVGDRFAPPPKRSKAPWLVLFLLAATAAGLIWWFRSDRNSGAVASPGPVPVDSDQRVEDIPNPAAY